MLITRGLLPGGLKKLLQNVLCRVSIWIWRSQIGLKVSLATMCSSNPDSRYRRSTSYFCCLSSSKSVRVELVRRLLTWWSSSAARSIATNEAVSERAAVVLSLAASSNIPPTALSMNLDCAVCLNCSRIRTRILVVSLSSEIRDVTVLTYQASRSCSLTWACCCLVHWSLWKQK